MQRFQLLPLAAGPPQGFAIQVDPLARHPPSFQQPWQQYRLQGARWEQGKDPREGVMGRNAVGKLKKGPQEGFVHFPPFRDLDKILTPSQYPTEAQDDEVDQRVFEILSLPTGIWDRLQRLHQGTRHCGHMKSLHSQANGIPLYILTPPFYKGCSAFAVAGGHRCPQPALVNVKVCGWAAGPQPDR
jgi:hypothetical protein